MRPYANFKSVVLGLLFTSLFLAFNTNASALTALQKNYLEAEKAQQSGDYNRYKSLVAKLDDYPLLPYLKYRELPANLAFAQQHKVVEFIQAYPDAPPAQLLYKNWMNLLFQQKQWQALLQFYQPTITDNEDLQCQRTVAQLYSGRRQEAFAKAKTLWLTPTSQPESCEALFQEWRKAGLLTDKLAWQRFSIAIEAKEIDFAKFLKRFLNSTQQTQADKWLKIGNDPQLVRSTKQIGSDNAANRDLAVYGIGRVASSNVDKAIEIWEKHQQSYHFSDAQRFRVLQSIGLQLALKKRPEAYGWLSQVPVAALDIPAHEWLIRSAMMNGRWKDANHWIAQLPTKTRQDLRWQYWSARALEQTGDAVSAQAIYHALAKNRHYYGFLAADHSQLPYAFQEAPLNLSQKHINGVIKVHQGILRAKEFLALGRTLEAKREWYRTTTRMLPSELPVAAFFASQWGWHDRAIIAMGKSDNKDDLALRFPVLYQNEVNRSAKKYGLNPALIYAVIRQESAFMLDAKSPVGALGLMQLMPATARELARKGNTSLRGDDELSLPNKNIDLGSMYLQRALRKYDLHPALTAASYNAGSTNVARWLPKGTESIDADLWVETVPFKETRNYVMNVMVYVNLYEHRLGQTPTRISERMPSIGTRLNVVAKQSDTSTN